MNYYPKLKCQKKYQVPALHGASKATRFMESTFSINSDQSEKVTLLKIRPRSDGIWMQGVFFKRSDKRMDAAQLVFHQYGEKWLKELIDRKLV